ncbi:KAT8 regulatory NSL complex subunit 1-like protein [Odontesthes bonariensis]|uniref:KAT8 regulatory NSL complex subunit 1-like protein n=1 Tax=Odontesthes bonariensis TaxID=219752 RepID=UPI003F588853
MAPALTKILKIGHGIHLSSPSASTRVDSDGSAIWATELEPHKRSVDDGDLQKMWLNLCSFPALDPYFSLCPLDVSVNPEISTCGQTSASQCEMVPLSSPGSLVSFLSFNKCQRDSHQVAAVFPGVSDMFLSPVPEHNSQEACLLHGQCAAPDCGTDGGDVHHLFAGACPSYSYGEITFLGEPPLLATQPKVMHGKVVGVACAPPPPPPHPDSVQAGIGMVNTDQLASKAVPEEALKEQLSRQARLEGRAWRLQRRLQSLLGEHTVLHCSQQLEGLEKHCQLGDVSLDNLDFICHGLATPQVCRSPRFSWQESSRASPFFTDVGEFSHSSQVVLRGLQEALDSEATGSSSSSDEEPEEYKIRGKISPVGSNTRERQWLEERAELSSIWSWLQLRLDELEGRMQQLVKLHTHIRSTKGGVVLADSQPLTDRQIQQTLMREMAGLSCTASDADAEPCSPTRLLHNIERQSAQLSQIVNSLMPPLSFSPPSKQPKTSKGRGTFLSGQSGDDVTVCGSSKRKRQWTRRIFKADVSCVCARTRPLVTYYKRKLFTFNFSNHVTPPKSRKSTSVSSSSLSSSSCSCGSSCDPVALCSNPDCSSSVTLSSRSSSSRPHSVAALLSESPTCHNFQRVGAREEWSQRPLVINSQLSSPAHYKRNSSTPRHNSRKYEQHARRHKNGVMGLSPIRSPGSAWGHRSRSGERKRKRGRVPRRMEDEEDVLYRLCNQGESSDDVLEDSYTQVTHKQASQGFVRKRQGDSVYNINDIVIPMTLSKVEKLQYKDILTPSWRVVDVQPLMEEKAEQEEDEEWECEDLGNEVFAQRHLVLEHKEKSRWSIWEKRKCCRGPTRSGSRLSGSGGGMCTSGEESSVEWSCAQLDTDEQPQSEEWLPRAPWDPRVFPLDEDEEAFLLSEDGQEVSSGQTESSSACHSTKDSNSHLSSAESACAAPPSPGQTESCAPSGS